MQQACLNCDICWQDVFPAFLRPKDTFCKYSDGTKRCLCASCWSKSETRYNLESPNIAPEKKEKSNFVFCKPGQTCTHYYAKRNPQEAKPLAYLDDGFVYDNHAFEITKTEESAVHLTPKPVAVIDISARNSPEKTVFYVEIELSEVGFFERNHIGLVDKTYFDPKDPIGSKNCIFFDTHNGKIIWRSENMDNKFVNDVFVQIFFQLVFFFFLLIFFRFFKKKKNRPIFASMQDVVGVGLTNHGSIFLTLNGRAYPVFKHFKFGSSDRSIPINFAMHSGGGLKIGVRTMRRLICFDPTVKISDWFNKSTKSKFLKPNFIWKLKKHLVGLKALQAMSKKPSTIEKCQFLLDVLDDQELQSKRNQYLVQLRLLEGLNLRTSEDEWIELLDRENGDVVKVATKLIDL